MARKLRPDSRKKVLNKARRTILKHLGIWLNRCCNELPDAKWFDATFSHGDLQVSVKHYRGKACKAKTKQEFMMLWYLKNAPSVVSPIASFNCGEDYMNILVVENLAGMVLLSDLLEGGNLPSKEALMLLRNLCRAVAEIHELKVVHTSLNPTTVFVDP
jgi:serine/threonine protein kinase